MTEEKWTKVTVDRETLAKLTALADCDYRSIPATIRYLVDHELAARELQAAHVAAMSGESCEAVK